MRFLCVFRLSIPFRSAKMCAIVRFVSCQNELVTIVKIFRVQFRLIFTSISSGFCFWCDIKSRARFASRNAVYVNNACTSEKKKKQQNRQKAAIPYFILYVPIFCRLVRDEFFSLCRSELVVLPIDLSRHCVIVLESVFNYKTCVAQFNVKPRLNLTESRKKAETIYSVL